MVIIADLAAFCSDLVTPRFVDSSCLLCYTIDVIADNDHACFMRPEQAFYKLLYILVTIQKINREGEQALQIALCDDEITIMKRSGSLSDNINRYILTGLFPYLLLHQEKSLSTM